MAELTPRQARLVAALLSNPTLKESAEEAGVSVATARRYLRLPHVRQALDMAVRGALVSASAGLAGHMGAALAELLAILEDPAASDSSKVGAARAILSHALRSHEQVTLGELVQRLALRLGLEV